MPTDWRTFWKFLIQSLCSTSPMLRSNTLTYIICSSEMISVPSREVNSLPHDPTMSWLSFTVAHSFLNGLVSVLPFPPATMARGMSFGCGFFQLTTSYTIPVLSPNARRRRFSDSIGTLSSSAFWEKNLSSLSSNPRSFLTNSCESIFVSNGWYSYELCVFLLSNAVCNTDSQTFSFSFHENSSRSAIMRRSYSLLRGTMSELAIGALAENSR
mmetsp:Transcript_8298/g.30621  ORF Transcript_8298/g.30621 Transcript_8298/m.30621 type:complete len:213 (+) Transcript_8298:479-1117(+)